jgi:hypothetical protein
MATRSLQIGDLVALVLIGLGLYLVYEAFADKERRVFSRAIAVLVLLCGGATVWIQIAQGRQSPTLMIGVAVILTALYVGYEASRAGGDTKGKEKEKSAAADEGWAGRAGNLWTVASILGVIGLVMAVQGLKMSLAQDQILPQLVQTMSIKTGMGFAFGVAGLLCALSALMKQRTMMFGTFWVLAAGFAIWFNWFHWVDLTHHWTQRDQYWVYYKLRKPDEPIAAFLMNWRGETFYSKNTVKQIKENNKLAQYAQLPGRKWAQVEHNRFGILKGAVGNEHNVTVVDKDLNNKFMLVSIE